MSTQRRANRTTPAIENDRADVRRWFRGCGGRTGISIPETRTSSLLASAPPQRQRPVAGGPDNGPANVDHLVGMGLVLHFRDKDLSPGVPMAVQRRKVAEHQPSGWPQTLCIQIAVSKLLPDLKVCRVRRPAVGQAAAGCSPARHASVIPSAHFHPSRPLASPPTLPQAPAGEVRWAERHDGKRDLYFQHAA